MISDKVLETTLIALGALAGVIAVGIIVLAVLYVPVIAPWWCDQVAEDYGLQDSKTRWGTCFVQIDDGTWIREENYRVVKE